MTNDPFGIGSNPPVAIGGLGGSGTRAVAQVLSHAGYYLGHDLNKSNDNLWFSLLFRRSDLLEEPEQNLQLAARMFIRAMLGGVQFSRDEISLAKRLSSEPRCDLPLWWLRQRELSLLSSCGRPGVTGLWGWKEPNTHIMIDRLLKWIPGLKYVHVLRNGLDMAFSSNQNQLRIWGPSLLGDRYSMSPRGSLRFWTFTTSRVLDIFSSNESQLLLLNFDRLCANPQSELGGLMDFLDLETSEEGLNDLSEVFHVPASTGRFKKHDAREFDEQDIRYVERLGFDTKFE